MTLLEMIYLVEARIELEETTKKDKKGVDK